MISGNLLSLSWWGRLSPNGGVGLLRNGVHVDLLPVVTCIGLRLDDLWTDDELLLNDQNGCIVVVKI